MKGKRMNYSFDIQHAIDYGLGEAVLIYNYQFWIKKNKANGRNFHNDKTWTYNSAKGLCELFPFWNDQQIHRLNKSLVEQGILETGYFSTDPRDRTLWYAFKEEDAFIKNDKSTYQKKQMDLSKSANPTYSKQAVRSEPSNVNADKDMSSDSSESLDTPSEAINNLSKQDILIPKEQIKDKKHVPGKKIKKEASKYTEIKNFFAQKLNGNIKDPEKWFSIQSKGIKILEAYDLEEIKKSYEIAVGDPRNKGLLMTPLLLQSKMKYGLNGSSNDMKYYGLTPDQERIARSKELAKQEMSNAN